MSARASTAPILKRNEIWLGIVLGSIGGILIGFFLGFFLGGGTSDGRPEGATLERLSPSAHTSEDSVERRTGVSGTKNWMEQTAAQFEGAPEHQPALGLGQAIVEALELEPPFDQARMLMLIDMMRKEDFPAALEVMRRTKTNLNSSTVGNQGPTIWIAFWKRFGQLDPETALATALKCGDLNYTNRNYMEKHLFAGMARANPVAAAEAFLAHPEMMNRNTAVEGLIEEWVKRDKNAALAWAQNLDDDLAKPAFYASAWGVSTKFDISGVNALVRSMPEGLARQSVIDSLKSQISHKMYLPADQILDSIAAFRELGARDPQFEAKIAARCAELDPYAAAAFFSQAASDGTEGDLKELKIVAAEWIRRDPKAAENWAKGKEGEAAYRIFAGAFLNAAKQRNDAAEAKRWMDKIGAPRETEPVSSN